MQLFMMNMESSRTVSLPDMPEGRFDVYSEDGKELLFIVNGAADGWHLKAVSPSMLIGEQEAILHEHHPILLREGTKANRCLLYPTPGSISGRVYARCLVPDTVSITVGSAGDNELICEQRYMGSHHLVFECRARAWNVKCMDTHYGMYVNGRRCLQKTLKPGDLVSILEQRFIVLPGMIAFNAPEEKTKLRSGSAIQPFKAPQISADEVFRSTEITDFFYRAPRFSQAIENQNLTVDSPPAPHEPSQTNALLTMAPSLLSGVVSLAVTTNPLLPLASLAGATIFPFLNRRNTEKQQIEDEEKRKAAYKAYLDDIERHIADVTKKQERILRNRMRPTAERVVELLKEHHKLWNRNSTQPDYLDLRLGTGSIPLEYDITFPQDHFELQSDPMKQLMRELRDRERKLEDVPIALHLSQFSRLGVTGRQNTRYALAANLIMQLAMDYGYDELKICIMGNVPELNVFSWLPHTWDNTCKNHLIAKDQKELYRLLPILDEILANRQFNRNVDISKLENGEAELVIFIFDSQMAQSAIVSRLLFERIYRGLRIITFTEHSRQLPRLSDAVVSIHHDEGRIIWQEETGSKVRVFQPEECAADYAERFVSLLANTYLDLPDTSTRIPESVPFLDLFHVQDVQSLNVLTRWKRNNPAVSLAAPIGIDEDGNVCYLDVHERGDGQHGLIAGMTGSGKSEFIMTYILALAVNYSPEDVAFLLIDYKGGGMAKAFQNLPHTAGIITNLDGNSINRSLLAIQSELVRRQEMFHNTEQALDISGLNIIKYQRLYREERVSTPLPHLLIITDEFAELKAQEPEFMQQLISASRIGRSLGIHLILATQKPSGVVDEQIWSNTNWRVCLRVQDARDSQDVIKCPDAASLPGVGRFYIQIGYGMLKQAQSGFTGAPYLPNSNATFAYGVDVLDSSGQVLQHSELPRTGKKGKTEYQIKAVVDYLQQVAAMQRMSCQPIWLPPLEPVISLNSLREKYNVTEKPYELVPIIGEVDDPATQSRRLLQFSMNEAKNTILYGAAGSGKAMFIITVLEGLMLSHTPEELNVYVLDYGDDGLAAFTECPHVGDVVLPQEDEKLVSLLRMLILEVERRKKLLSGGMGEPLASRLSKANLPNILVVAHHTHVLKEKMNDDLSKLLKLLRDGPRYGVTFLATTTLPSLIGFKLQEVFSRIFVLQMDRDEDYNMIIGRTGGFRPEAVRGRGLIKEDTLCEYQTATPDYNHAEDFCRLVSQMYPDKKAKEIRVLPKRVTADILNSAFSKESPWLIPVGLDASNFEPVSIDLKQRFVHLFLAEQEDAAAFISECLPLMLQTQRYVTVWGSEMIKGRPLSEIQYVPLMESERFVNELFGEMNAVAIAMKKGEAVPEVKEKLIIVPAIAKALDQLKGNRESNAYTRIISYITNLKPLYKCSFLIFGTPQELKPIQYEEWYKRQVSSTDGYYFGEGIGGQYVLTVSNNLSLSNKESAFPFGYEVRNGKGRRIKFLSDHYIEEKDM